jgi:putative transposase
VNAVKKYIETQKEHHKKLSVMDEYRNLLDEYGIPYEEKYL